MSKNPNSNKQGLKPEVKPEETSAFTSDQTPKQPANQTKKDIQANNGNRKSPTNHNQAQELKTSYSNQDNDIYEINYKGELKQINMPIVEYDFQFIQALSCYLNHFVRIKGKKEYGNNTFHFDSNEKQILVEDSFPLVRLNNKYYAFLNQKELFNFYNNELKLHIISIKFFENAYNKDTISISDFKDEKLLFDFLLEIETVKLLEKEYIINGEQKKITVYEDIPQTDLLNQIKADYYNNRKFIFLDITEANEIIASIQIKWNEKSSMKLKFLPSIKTTKDFLNFLEDKYKCKNLKITNRKNTEDELINVDTENDFLQIGNLKLYELYFTNSSIKKLFISNKFTIKDVLNQLYPRGSDDKFFFIDNELIISKLERAHNYNSKEIFIFDLNETPITIEFKPESLGINPIHINSEKIESQSKNFKSYVLDDKKIPRNLDDFDISYKNKKIDDDFTILNSILTDSIKVNGEYIISFNVTFKPVTFTVFEKNSGKKTELKYNTEIVGSLIDKYECSKINFLNNNAIISNERSFLTIDPNKNYIIEVIDKYYFKDPSQNVEELELSRYQTFEEAISKQENIKDIPYNVFKDDIDISKNEITRITKNTEDKPYILKIKYSYKKKDKQQIKSFFIDNPNTNVKEHLAKWLNVTTVERVEAHIIKKEGETEYTKVKEIKEEDTFENLDYKRNEIFEISKLPPLLSFSFDTQNLKNILIKEDLDDIMSEAEFKYRFEEDDNVSKAKKKIRKKYQIENKINLIIDNDKNLKGDQKMFDINESNIITIQIIPPKYKFKSIQNETYSKNYEKNVKVRDVLISGDFKEKNPPKNENHDIILKIEDTELDENEPIFNYYEKNRIIECIQLDPQYSFHFEDDDYLLRIPDGKSFMELRELMKLHFNKLKDIQSSRIQFYKENSDNYCESNALINDEFKRSNNKIIIKLIDPEYTFQYEDEKQEKIRFKKETITIEAISEIENRIKLQLAEVDKKNHMKYDIQLLQNESILRNKINLFDAKLFNEPIKVKKYPIKFSIHIVNSDDLHLCRFKIADLSDSKDPCDPFGSGKISLQTLLDKNLIVINKNKKDFEFLEEEEEEELERAKKLPPIERFKVSFEGHIISADEPFFNIINGDKTKVIDIELLPPKFTFKLLSGIIEEQIDVERGTTVSRIRSDIREKLGLGKYDFDLMSKPNTNETEEAEPDKHKKDEEVVEPMDDESSFDDYEQGETVFIVIPKKPLYKFKIMSNGKLSKVKQFRIDPRSTVREIKAITLPSTKAKRLDIYGPISIDEKEIPKGLKPLDDMSILEKTSSKHPDAVYIILIKELKHKLQIKLPEFDQDNKDVELEVESNDTVEDIKNDLSEKIKNKKLALYHLNKRLNDDEKYDDLIIVKGSQIQCMYEYDLIFADKQYEALKTTDIIDDKLTVFECKKKCFDLIENSHLKNKIKNLKRIQLKISDDIINDDNKTIWKLMKKAKKFQITVIVNEDEDFKAICDNKGSLPSGLKCESTVSELRKKCPNNIIIKLSDSGSIVFDDQNLFEIQGHKTCIQDLEKEDKMKEIIIEIDKKVDVRKDKLRTVNLPIAYDTDVDDIKEIVADKCLNDYNQIKDICVVFNEIKPIEAKDPYLKDFPYINYGNNGRILCDTQNLYAIGAKRLLIVNKNSISAPEGSPYILVTYYDKDDNLCEDQEISYSSEMSVGDIIANISTEMNTRGKEEDLETILLYMGKILDPSMLLKNILVDGHNKFYCRKVRKMLTEH